MQNIRNSAIILVAIHAAVSLIHGLSHLGAEVGLSPFDEAFVGIVIALGPLVAAFLLRERSWQLGAWLYLVAMFGSLAFGIHHHYLVPGPDNVAFQQPGVWQLPFQATAFLLALLEVAGCIIGLRLVNIQRLKVAKLEGR